MYRDGGNDGNFTLVYNGTNRPGRRTYISTGLTSGTFYRFKVVAMNFNGYSTESSELVVPSCLPPSGVSAPTYVSGSSTETTIVLRWDAPTQINGCALTGFNLYKGTLTSSTLTLDATVSTALSTHPSARSVTVSFDAADSGTSYRFQLEAINAAGSSRGGISEITLAGPPDAPSSGPVRVAEQTNNTHITVQLFTSMPDLGEGTLKQVHLQMDNGGDGNYRDLIGPNITCIDTIYTVSEGIEESKSYQFRYRVKNENGWSDYSPITVITAASAPSAPHAPTLNSATASSITLDFYEVEYNGGSDIETYNLYIND